MKLAIKSTEPDMPNEVEELSIGIGSATCTKDHEDDRDDEHADENEIPVRETDEDMEAPEEFQLGDKDAPGSADDDDSSDDDHDEVIE